MTEETQNTDELTALKKRADILGVQYSNNIGVETLRERVNAALAEKPAQPPAPVQEETQNEIKPNPLNVEANSEYEMDSPPTRPLTIREKVYKEKMKLVRIRITCMNPNKKGVNAEYFTVGNKYIGTVRKLVPFENENGWHVPYCIYEMIRDKKFLQVTSRTDPKTNTPIITRRYVREYAIEVMEPLTQKELKELGQRQMASGAIDHEVMDMV